MKLLRIIKLFSLFVVAVVARLLVSWLDSPLGGSAGELVSLLDGLN